MSEVTHMQSESGGMRVKVVQRGSQKPMVQVGIGHPPTYFAMYGGDAELLASLLIKAASETRKIGYDPEA